MKPTLWGPGLWHLMLSISWNCREEDLPTLLKVLLHDIPALLPCARCRSHYVRSHATLKRRFGEPKHRVACFEWVYHLKDEVNKITKTRSIPLQDARERLNLSGGRVDDVLVSDTLLLVAIHADMHDMPHEFVALCHNLLPLLPLPADSQLLRSLKCMRVPILVHAYNLFRDTRIEHGIKSPSMEHVRCVALRDE